MTYKMAIIGFGGMGSWHFENINEKIKTIEVIGAFDIRPEVHKKIERSGLKVYKSAEEIYADIEIDIVLIATPNNFHKFYSLAVLNANKNVICEKPVTLNALDLEEIIALAKNKDKLFTVHQNRRWDGDYLTIKRILAENILNEPYIIESRVQGSRRDLHGWRGHKLNGGGMVYDWGIPLIDQMLDLIPEKVVSVNAHLHNIFAPEADDSFTAMMRFENGITYIINVDMNCFILQPRWHMSCKDGTAIIENWEQDGKIVKLSNFGEMDWAEDILYTAAGPTRSMVPRPKETTIEIALPKETGQWEQFYNNISLFLDGKEEICVKPEQVLRAMKVTDEIFKSQQVGTSVSCNI